MTTSVTIKNNGPYRVNVNETEIPEGERMKGTERLVQSHTLEVGAEVTLRLYGAFRFITVIETNDVDTAAPEGHARGAAG